MTSDDAFFLLIAVPILIVVSLRLAWRKVGLAVTHLRERHPWETVTGTVRAAGVRTEKVRIGFKREPIFLADVAYDYAVDGRSYVGTTLRPGYEGGMQWTAKRLAARFRPGAAVTVYYDPIDPTVAVLDPRFDRGTLATGLTFLLLALLLIGILLLLLAVS